jgi:hypothetical protein
MADQLIKCSRCKCHRAVSAFKLKKSGARNKTCMQCAIRKPIVPPIKLASFADPPAPIVTMSASDKAPVLKVVDDRAGCMVWLRVFPNLWTRTTPFWREVVHSEYQWRTRARIRTYYARIKRRNAGFRYNLSIPVPMRTMDFLEID